MIPWETVVDVPVARLSWLCFPLGPPGPLCLYLFQLIPRSIVIVCMASFQLHHNAVFCYWSLITKHSLAWPIVGNLWILIELTSKRMINWMNLLENTHKAIRSAVLGWRFKHITQHSYKVSLIKIMFCSRKEIALKKFFIQTCMTFYTRHFLKHFSLLYSYMVVCRIEIL